MGILIDNILKQIACGAYFTRMFFSLNYRNEIRRNNFLQELTFTGRICYDGQYCTYISLVLFFENFSIRIIDWGRIVRSFRNFY